jgi:hypothetical protein
MPEQTEWEQKAANILKARLKLNGVSYGQLADLINEKEPSVRNKLSRGKFSASFMIQCFEAIGEREIRL